MINFKPQKGKAFDKLPLKTLKTFPEQEYLVSTKYDGNQIFIVKEGNSVRWFTSDWKEFNLPVMGAKLNEITYDFTMVAEINYGGLGKLGERTVVQGKLTTERVNFNKGLSCSLDEDKVSIKVFDFLTQTPLKYKFRLNCARGLKPKLPVQVHIVNTVSMLGKDIDVYAKALVKLGWEGVMASEPDEVYCYGKRVNHAIKIKYRPTADLRCIDTELGEGKYANAIGALVLQDSKDRLVKVGSGLSDEQRFLYKDNFIGKVIEIEYEQLMDTYQQPVFKYIREEKEID